VDFVAERHRIYERRARGELSPWTTCPILSAFRFCNIHRQADRTTIWIAKNWRGPHAADPDLWFAMCVARVLNWQPSLEAIGYPVVWDPARFVSVLEARAKRGLKVVSMAYKVPTPREKGTRRIPFIAHEVLTPISARREHLRARMTGTLADAHEALSSCDYLGGFLSAQIIADLKYVGPLRHAVDWATFAAMGPGSARGLNRALDRPRDSAWQEPAWYKELVRLHTRVTPHYAERGLPATDMQDLQNQLCEFDRYERVRLSPDKASLRRWRPNEPLP
jgi:hypothetical protein